MPRPSIGKSLVARFATLSLTVIFEFVLVGLAAGLWWLDGRPGLAVVRTTGERWVRRARLSGE